jgi:hypothetical protein
MSKHGPWTWYRVCVDCNEALSHDTFYYGGGVCPHCGHNAKSTICDARKVIRRKVYHEKLDRRSAVLAQKASNNPISFAGLRLLWHKASTRLFRSRPFTWEYKDKPITTSLGPASARRLGSASVTPSPVSAPDPTGVTGSTITGK